MTDPIIEELYKIRQDYASQFNYDLEAIYRDLKEKQAQSQQPVYSFEDKKPPKISTNQ